MLWSRPVSGNVIQTGYAGVDRRYAKAASRQSKAQQTGAAAGIQRRRPLAMRVLDKLGQPGFGLCQHAGVARAHRPPHA